jgi:hypothetical protein
MIEQKEGDDLKADLEKTARFKEWEKAKLEECSQYVKRSFNEVLPASRMMMFLTESGFPDPILQQNAHARIWGYNYELEPGITAINPATGKPMTYTVWKKLLADPQIEPVESTIQ